MTLNVKGSIVKGTLISAKDYFKELSKGFEDGEGIAREIGRYMSNTGLSVDSQEITPARFIHLKDVELIGADGQSALADGNKLWRGRLSEVDGFNLDQDITVETDDDESDDDSDEEKSDDSKKSSKKKPDKKKDDKDKNKDSDEEDDDSGLFERLDDLEDKMKGLLPDSVAEDEEDSGDDEEEEKKDDKKSSSKSKKSSSSSKKSTKSSSKK